MTFGFNFDQSLDNTNLPSGLQSLEFGYNFTQSLDNVKDIKDQHILKGEIENVNAKKLTSIDQQKKKH